MEIVNFLAQFWGFSLIIVSLAFLIKPKHVENILTLVEDTKNELVFGILNVMLGIALILWYNVWDSSWRVIITILAWLILVRGIVCLFFPEVIKTGAAKVKSHKEWVSYALVVCIIIGCLLAYLGQTF